MKKSKINKKKQKDNLILSEFYHFCESGNEEGVLKCLEYINNLENKNHIIYEGLDISILNKKTKISTILFEEWKNENYKKNEVIAENLIKYESKELFEIFVGKFKIKSDSSLIYWVLAEERLDLVDLILKHTTDQDKIGECLKFTVIDWSVNTKGCEIIAKKLLPLSNNAWKSVALSEAITYRKKNMFKIIAESLDGDYKISGWMVSNMIKNKWMDLLDQMIDFIDTKECSKLLDSHNDDEYKKFLIECESMQENKTLKKNIGKALNSNKIKKSRAI